MKINYHYLLAVNHKVEKCNSLKLYRKCHYSNYLFSTAYNFVVKKIYENRK